MIESKSEKKGFYKLLSALAFPMVLQNLIDACVGMADTVMLGYVSQSALSAASLANQVQFVLFLFFYGITSGSSVLIAQYWGRKDLNTINKTLGIALRLSLCVGALFMAAALVAPGVIMRIFSPDPEIIALGSDYLRIVAPGYLFSAFTSIYVGALRATERVAFGTVVNSISLGTNILLNACFIFGLFFFPKLGIRGVALGTTIARLIALGVCILDALRSKTIKVKIKYMFERNKLLMKDFIKYTLPALGNDIVWGLGFSAYSVILGHMGSDAVAANSYANVVRSIATVACFAVANVAAIVLGKTLGQGKLDEAKLYAKRFKVIAILTGLVASGSVLASIPFVTANVNLTGVALGYLKYMLYISAVCVFGQSVNTMLICGVFRSGGDTKFGFYMDTIVMWGYSVALGSIAAFVLKLPVQVVYTILFFDEVVKMPSIIIRSKKNIWLRDITRDMNTLGAGEKKDLQATE